MVVRKARTKSSAKMMAARARRRGLKATVFNPKGKGFAVSITRKKK